MARTGKNTALFHLIKALLWDSDCYLAVNNYTGRTDKYIVTDTQNLHASLTSKEPSQKRDSPLSLRA